VEDALILNNQKHRKKPAGFVRLWAALTMPCVALCAAEPTPKALSTNQPGSAGGATNATLQAALQKLKFPGVAIDVQERCVDVESAVCLHRGALELVACTKGTKEHESIVAIGAKPMHIHAALLLLGAKPGSPATRQQLGDQAGRWIEVPYIWWMDKPYYRSIVLNMEEITYLKKGKNVLAAYANDQYGKNSPNHYAAIDLWIDGISKVDQEKLDLALEGILSPKDREALKGASNGGYHYLGSAKIFAQMGKAFAEALLTLQK
jgi:hypothetical protein